MSSVFVSERSLECSQKKCISDAVPLFVRSMLAIMSKLILDFGSHLLNSGYIACHEMVATRSLGEMDYRMDLTFRKSVVMTAILHTIIGIGAKTSTKGLGQVYR